MANLPPQPPVNLKIADPETGVPANYWQDYLIAVDRLLRDLQTRVTSLEKQTKK
jgi:hypothetical protein